MTDENRVLVVIRHAKAEQGAPTDYERQLTGRGVDDATAAGRWLRERGIEPDLALVSAAARTTQTWEAVADGAGWDINLASYEESLYDAGPAGALELLNGVEDVISCVVMIGHNPTMAFVAQLLDDGEGPASDDLASSAYPTSAVTVLEYDGDWSDLDEASSRTVGFHVARG